MRAPLAAKTKNLRTTGTDERGKPIESPPGPPRSGWVQLLGTTKDPVPANPAALTGAARRQYDTLVLIIEEADKATTDSERKKLLAEFLEKSDTFLKENPDQSPIWTLRAVAAIELNNQKQAMQAGAELIRLGAERSDDPKIRKVMAMLDRKGWLKTPQQLAEAKKEDERRQAEAKVQEEQRQTWRLVQQQAAEHREKKESRQRELDAAYRKGSESYEGAKSSRGMALQALASLAAFLADSPKATESIADPRSQRIHYAHLVIAWILSTSNHDTVRDGQKALVHAREAVASEAPKLFWHREDPLEVLAAAQAESGDFTAAVQTAEKAIAQVKSGERRADQARLTAQLKQYKKRKPWRE